MAKRFIPPFGNDRIRLRLIEEKDLPMTLAWRNQDHIRKWFFYSDIISPEHHQAWFTDYLERDNDYVFIIEEKYKFKRPIGQISIYHIEWNRKIAELGRFMIGDAEANRKGFAKQACQLLIEFSFIQLKLTEIYLRVLKNNNPAITFYQKLNFRITWDDDVKVVMKLTSPSTEKNALY